MINNNSKNLIKALTGVVLASSIFFSCKKSDSTTTVTPPSPIGGYNSSNDVAAASLKAHWTFDATNNEAISNVGPATIVGASFVTGVKGQALQLNSGYLLYPATITNLNAQRLGGGNGSFTVSAWIKTDNNGTQATSVFSLTQGTATQTDWNTGAITMYLETSHATATDDTLVLHGAFSTYFTGSRQGGDNINDYGVRETDFKTVHGTNQWVHYVERYDTTGSVIDLYANGVRVSNNNFRARGLGPVVTTTPTQVLIGAFANASTGFANSAVQPFEGLYTGAIDEVRVYNSALSDADISALYQLEKAGR